MPTTVRKSPAQTTLVLLLLIILIAPINPQHTPQAAAQEAGAVSGTPPLDPDTDSIMDPCSLIPAGGKVFTNNETTCLAQYGAQGGEKVVQVNLGAYGAYSETQCAGLMEPSDYHELDHEVDFGHCGIQVTVGYKGEPASGYTGWAIYYDYEGVRVRVATSQDYPANRLWVYETAGEIEKNIEAQLGVQKDPEPDEADESGLPSWIGNDRVFIDRDWTIYEVPEWLDWIKPKQSSPPVKSSIRPYESGGEIWVYNRAFDKWKGPIRAEVPLYSGDMVLTGPNTSAMLRISDPEGQRAGDSIFVGSDTLLESPYSPDAYTSEHPNLWSLYRGLVKIKRAVLREEPELGYSPFVIRTPNCVVGSRGTEFIVSVDPESDESSIYLLSGELNTYNLAAGGPESAVLTSGNHWVVGKDGSEFTAPYDIAEVEALISQHNLAGAETIPDEQSELLGVESETAEEKGDASPFPIGIVLLGVLFCLAGLVVLGGVVVVVVILARNKARRQPH